MCFDPAQTAKRDYLVELERKAQSSWRSQELFNIDAPSPTTTYLNHVNGSDGAPTPSEIRAQQAKWLGTFPYPYMNGSLHLGHAFTVSKIEFACGFERMLGKRALFPMGFHLTGLPIKVSIISHLWLTCCELKWFVFDRHQLTS